jgi:4-oxalocrotonate tautomerase family enzyme
MPVLTYEGPRIPAEQKERLIKELTEAACRVMPDKPKEAYYVFLKEFEDESIGVAGMPLAEYIKQVGSRSGD